MLFGWTKWEPKRKDKICEICGVKDKMYERDFLFFGFKIKHQIECDKCQEFLENSKTRYSNGSKRKLEKEKKYGK